MASTYCTATDVKSYYGMLRWEQLTADSGDDADDDLILDACVKQSRLMDSYLIGRYTTPIAGPANVLDVLKVHCIRLSLYVLFQGRLMADEYHSILNDRDITIKWLESIASNKASIPGQSQPVAVLLSDDSPIGGGMQQIFGTEEPLF